MFKYLSSKRSSQIIFQTKIGRIIINQKQMYFRASQQPQRVQRLAIFQANSTDKDFHPQLLYFKHQYDVQEHQELGRQNHKYLQYHGTPLENLQRRLRYLEQNLFINAQKVNQHTLQTLYHLKDQIFNRMTAHDQSFLERTYHLASIEAKWNEKSQQNLDKMEKVIQNLERKLEEQKENFKNIKSNQFQELIQKVCLQVKQMGRSQEKIEKLEERINLRIKEEIEMVEVLREKITKIEELPEIKIKISKYEQENKILTNLRKVSEEQPEKILDKTSASWKCFLVEGNKLSRQSGDNTVWKMIMLDAVMGEGKFNLCTLMGRKNGFIEIGLTDRLTQRHRDYAQVEHSIKYFSAGNINYAIGDGKYQTLSTGEELLEDMEIVMEVDKPKCTVTFLFEGGHQQGIRQYTVKSPILGQLNRQFVPFYEMNRIGSSVTWRIQ